MNALDSRIKELVAYARERDGEDRTALFRNLVDLFLTNKAPTKQPTRSQLLDVVNALIPHVEPESRRIVSDLLASINNPPMDLIHCIVKDRASLVSSLLRAAPFEEDELIELIETTGREHHQELASRSDLSANVWIALARATPAAPPYGSNSTLALWREDLGLNKQNDLPDLSNVPRHDLASVTPLHPKKHQKSNARIRILRTDEDIVSNHLNENSEDATISFVEEETSIEQTINNIKIQTSKDTSEDNIRSDEQKSMSSTDDLLAKDASPSFKSLELPQAYKADELQKDQVKEFNTHPDKNTTINRPLIEPESGSWAWRSDRDGFIIMVSKQAETLLGNDYQLIGAAMLDMLALNTKLGHPVSRAFQRRASIHEAPIYLAHLEHTQRYWTLEAAPLFNPKTGAFDGYEGILKPVIPARDEGDIIPADESSPDVVGYPDISEHNKQTQQAHDRKTAPADSDIVAIPQVTSNQSSLSWFDKPGLGGSENSIPQTHSGENTEKQKKQADAHTPDEQKHNKTHVTSRILTAVNKHTSNNNPTESQEHSEGLKGRYPLESDISIDKTTLKNTQAAAEVETTLSTSSLTTIESTLQLMEEALLRLSEAEANHNLLQIKLQSEIAQACARTLKSEFAQLKK
jgi:hypothetical protein